MALPDLSVLCQPIQIRIDPNELCIVMPGGAETCVQMPDVGVIDPLEAAKQLLAQGNAALAPLVPVFNIIDMVLQVKKCLDATPDVVFNPKKLIDCLAELGPKTDKLLALIPQLAVPLLVLGLIDAILAFLAGVVDQLRALQVQLQAVAIAATRAADLGDAGASLRIVVDCAEVSAAAQIQSLNDSVAPLNRLIGLINLVLEIAQLQPLPELTGFGDDAEAAIDIIDGLVTQLQAIRDTLPV